MILFVSWRAAAAGKSLRHLGINLKSEFCKMMMIMMTLEVMVMAMLMVTMVMMVMMVVMTRIKTNFNSLR